MPWQPGQAPVVPPPVAQPLPFQQQPVFQQQPAQQPVGYAAGSNAPAGPGGYAYQGQGQGQGQGQAQGYPGGYSVPQASGQFAAPSAPGFGQQQYTAYAPATGGYQLPASYPVPQPRPKQPVLGLWAVIFGVIAVIGGVIFGWTLPFAVAAIVMGFVARKKELSYRGRALAAIITGFVGLVLSLGWLTYSFVVLFT